MAIFLFQLPITLYNRAPQSTSRKKKKNYGTREEERKLKRGEEETPNKRRRTQIQKKKKDFFLFESFNVALVKLRIEVICCLLLQVLCVQMAQNLVG